MPLRGAVGMPEERAKTFEDRYTSIKAVVVGAGGKTGQAITRRLLQAPNAKVKGLVRDEVLAVSLASTNSVSAVVAEYLPLCSSSSSHPFSIEAALPKAVYLNYKLTTMQFCRSHGFMEVCPVCSWSQPMCISMPPYKESWKALTSCSLQLEQDPPLTHLAPSMWITRYKTGNPNQGNHIAYE